MHAPDPGHVFVIRGDLKNLACSAWMQTTDKRLRPGGRWETEIPEAASRITAADRAAFETEEVYSIPVWPRDEDSAPIPFLTAVPFHGVSTADDFRPRVRAFVEAAAPIVRNRPVAKRPRPLLAMPPIGFGRGGGHLRKGDVVRMVLDEARSLAEEFEVDIAIVFRGAPKGYALAQHLRHSQGHSAWPELDARELEHARRLGDLARLGRLVPFMGAGVSVSAGAPTWKELIEKLADLADLAPNVRRALSDQGRNVLDQATFVRQAIGARFPEDELAFVRAIAEITDVHRYGLAPALLAALESEQSITLNYDRLFEMAAEDGGLPRRTIPSVVPRDAGQDRWLLKLHGSVDDPSSIVLTRSDYLGFNTERAALSSIVKATLMTRHVLFVGFGMSDDHFHEIIHDVRRAMAPTGTALRSVGTVLTLRDDLLDRELLGELDFVPFSPTSPVSPASPESIFLVAARRLEIFLDAVLAFAADSHAYLLDETYAHALTPEERQLRDGIQTMVIALPDSARHTTSWKVVDRMLRDLGGDPEPLDSSPANSEGRVRARESPPPPRRTPDRVVELGENEIFVFGSNGAGQHGGGAAHAALAFGAEWGEGHGLHGRTYAIDTMSGWEVLAGESAEFVTFAADHPELTFLLTPVGCGIAGYSADAVAPLFRSAPPNVILPESFARLLGR